LLPLTLPLAGALLIWLGCAAVEPSGRGRVCGALALGVTAAVLLCLGASWLGGAVQGDLSLDGVLGWGLRFRVDPAGLFFALAASFLWFMATLFSLRYMAHGHAHRRYYAFLLLSLCGTLGVFLARDLFTLFLFFELVSLGSYPLVAQEETPEALAAGRLYLFMGLAGGLALLWGTMWLESLAGTTALGAHLVAGSPSWPWVASVALIVAGFGVKAGVFPVHIWLPRAHPVAPAPASALLSGVMIKTGAYGIFRLVRLFAAPAEHGGTVPAFAAGLGYALLALGLVTTFVGAFLALGQSNAKRILAYSSMSQMGYLLLGLGMAGLLGDGEAMAAAGFTLHVLNHGLFKATMFILAGVVYLRSHDLDLGRLGGLGRRLPVTATVFALAVAGIAGVPGLNGYASKTLLHDAILLLRHGQPGPIWGCVEVLFTLASALTVCYTARLWYLLFWPRRSTVALPGRAVEPERETRLEVGVAICLALAMLAVGLAPGLARDRLLEPALLAVGYEEHAVHHVAGLEFFGWQALKGALLPLGLGSCLFLALRALGFPYPDLSGGPSVEGTFLRPLARLGGVLVLGLGSASAWLAGRLEQALLGRPSPAGGPPPAPDRPGGSR
jgi:formate hydrogenlyase subunit 3/multisubunit Na+/H+ antiporter MnhD subunit